MDKLSFNIIQCILQVPLISLLRIFIPWFDLYLFIYTYTHYPPSPKSSINFFYLILIIIWFLRINRSEQIKKAIRFHYFSHRLYLPRYFIPLLFSHCFLKHILAWLPDNRWALCTYRLILAIHIESNHQNLIIKIIIFWKVEDDIKSLGLIVRHMLNFSYLFEQRKVLFYNLRIYQKRAITIKWVILMRRLE